MIVRLTGHSTHVIKVLFWFIPTLNTRKKKMIDETGQE